MQATPSDRATLLVAAGSAGVALMVGFNLGAYGVVFFDQLLTVWAFATVVLVASIVSDIPPSTWPRRLILLVPTLWLIAAWIDASRGVVGGEKAVFGLTLVVTIFAFPVVAWILVTAINPDFGELDRRHKLTVVAVVVIATIVGFGIGARNDLILNCDDFKVSGNDLPDNCVRIAPEQ